MQIFTIFLYFQYIFHDSAPNFSLTSEKITKSRKFLKLFAPGRLDNPWKCPKWLIWLRNFWLFSHTCCRHFSPRKPPYKKCFKYISVNSFGENIKGDKFYRNMYRMAIWIFDLWTNFPSKKLLPSFFNEKISALPIFHLEKASWWPVHPYARYMFR